MSGPLEDGIKRWAANRKSALVIEIMSYCPFIGQVLA